MSVELIILVGLNVVLLGSLYLLGKGIERLVWYVIENYDKSEL